MSSAVAARLLGNERGVSKSPAPESVPGSPSKASPVKSPLGLPGSPGTKRKADDEEGGEESKRVKLEPGTEGEESSTPPAPTAATATEEVPAAPTLAIPSAAALQAFLQGFPAATPKVDEVIENANETTIAMEPVKAEATEADA